MLAQTPLAKNQWRCPEGNGSPRLSELGINGQQSSRQQLFASVEDELFHTTYQNGFGLNRLTQK